MNEADILQRIEALEKAVFNISKDKRTLENNGDLNSTYSKFLMEFKRDFTPLKAHFSTDDTLAFQAIMNKSTNSSEFHITSLSTLVQEEKDEDIASMCSILSSHQRLSILRYLSQAPLSSGEMVELTQMAGGHLHHHLKELQSKSFIKKESSGKYTVTDYGLNIYLSIAALNRRVIYQKDVSSDSNL